MAGSIPNRANDPKRKANQDFGHSQYGKENFHMLYNSITAHQREGREYNPIGKTDLNIVRSGASNAFKKMGFKTPMERAKARESRPGKPPLPGF